MSEHTQDNPFSTHMSDAVRNELLNIQSECTFIWQGEQEAIGTIMSFLWADDCIWLTTDAVQPRIRAIKRHGRACVVISSAGTALGGTRCISFRGPCTLLNDSQTRDWFYPRFCQKLFPDNLAAQVTMRPMLDRDGQIILRLQPDKSVAYDGNALMSRMANIKV
jgi:hypothetical protein